MRLRLTVWRLRKVLQKKIRPLLEQEFLPFANDIQDIPIAVREALTKLPIRFLPISATS